LIKFIINFFTFNYKIEIDKMSRFTKQPIFPITFNGYNPFLIMKIAEKAQKELQKIDPSRDFPIPFFNKSAVGTYANFKCKIIADKVTDFLEKVISHDFPESYSSPRLLVNLFYHCIEEDKENFIYFVDERTFFLFHQDEMVAKDVISKMTQMLEKYMIQYPFVLISELLLSCAVKLTEREMLIIPCGMKTFLMPIYSKEAQFTKAFSKTLSRVIKKNVECKGMDFYDVKEICKEIDIKGVYFYITPEYVELSGLPFNVNNFCEILKRRLKEHQTEARVLSRK
jgi:hypothetical protein